MQSTPFCVLIHPGSMLHAMFSGRFDTKPDEDGTYFIDRDGTHFRYILNYLRTGELVVPDDKTVRHELLIEAKFYQVEGIIEALIPKPFQDSVILSSDQRQTLVNWCKDATKITNARDKLLYRASRDGWAASHFHSCCDNAGPTVTVIKSGNYIFGGYTDQNWESKFFWQPFILFFCIFRKHFLEFFSKDTSISGVRVTVWTLACCLESYTLKLISIIKANNNKI